MLRCLTLIFFLQSFQVINAQSQKPLINNSLLIYFKSERDFKAVVIERMLDNLHLAGQPSKKILSQAINLEDLQLMDDLNKDITILLEKLSEGIPDYQLDSITISQNELIAFFLLEYDYLLVIKTNPVHLSASEFQFKLFEVAAGTIAIENQPGKLPTVLIQSKKDTSVIISLMENQDILIKNALQTLFPITNFPPIPSISLNNQQTVFNKKYYFAKQDSFQIDGINSTDDDTPRAFWQFRWRQINEDGKPNASKEHTIPIKKNEAEQWIQPPEVGNYSIGLQLFDGVTISPSEDTLQLQIIQRPQIALSKMEFRNKSKITVFDWLFRKEYRQNKFSTQFQGFWGNSNFPISDMNLRLIKKQTFQQSQTIQAKWKRLDENTFEFGLTGKLKDDDYFEYLIEGNFEGVTATPSQFILQKPEKEFVKIDFGFDAFLGFDILQPKNDSTLFARMPLSIKGGVFLYHWNHLNPKTQLSQSSGSLSLDIGVMIPVRLSNFHYAIGQMTLKVKAHYDTPSNKRFKQISLFVAAHATGVNWKEDANYKYRNFWGFGLGVGFPKWRLELDLINFHYDFRNTQLIYSWGFRRNIATIFTKNKITNFIIPKN